MRGSGSSDAWEWELRTHAPPRRSSPTPLAGRSSPSVVMISPAPSLHPPPIDRLTALPIAGQNNADAESMSGQYVSVRWRLAAFVTPPTPPQTQIFLLLLIPPSRTQLSSLLTLITTDFITTPLPLAVMRQWQHPELTPHHRSPELHSPSARATIRAGRPMVRYPLRGQGRWPR